ncbi:MAG: hypothetical protein KDA89_16230, partial [Planctomycetaceae bacterium]|nr:hypothetical protein [Planctomycetaceae bacterium]
MKCVSCQSDFSREQVRDGLCPVCGTRLKRQKPRPSTAAQLPPRRGEAKPGKKLPQKERLKTSSSRPAWMVVGAAVACILLIGVGVWAIANALTATDTRSTDVVSIRDSTVVPETSVGESSTPTAEEPPPEASAPAVVEPPVKIPNPDIEKLLREQKIALRQDIIDKVEEALARVEKEGYGHVVVGQIQVPGGGSPRDVIS